MEYVYLVYKNYDGSFREEAVRAEKFGEFYKIKSIPLWASHLAYDDLVSVETDDKLYFLDLVEASKRSVLHVVLFENDSKKELIGVIDSFGCDYLFSEDPNYLAIDVPPEVDYKKLKDELEVGLRHDKWDYKESCLSELHRKLIED